MHVYVQKSTSTTFPRRPAAVSGGVEPAGRPLESREATFDRQVGDESGGQRANPPSHAVT